MTTELDTLIQAYCRGDASGDSIAQLAAMLKDNNEHQHYFREQVHIHRALVALHSQRTDQRVLALFHDIAKADQHSATAARRIRGRIRHKRRSTVRFQIFALAAGILICIGLIVFIVNRTNAGIATLIRSQAAPVTVQAKQQLQLHKGDQIQLGADFGHAIALEASHVTVSTHNKGRVMNLHSGALQVSVTHGAQVAVQSPHSLSEALGTEFTVRCHPEASITQVFDGIVRVSTSTGQRSLSPGDQAIATADELVLIGTDTQLVGPEDFKPETGPWRLNGPAVGPWARTWQINPTPDERKANQLSLSVPLAAGSYRIWLLARSQESAPAGSARTFKDTIQVSCPGGTFSQQRTTPDIPDNSSRNYNGLAAFDEWVWLNGDHDHLLQEPGSDKYHQLKSQSPPLSLSLDRNDTYHFTLKATEGAVAVAAICITPLDGKPPALGGKILEH
ncbi:MAG: FecR domain-containing protein [Planctomycetota bacterium]|jgi:ferric-dicitrate binding protein FerR (iron transport regulator)|nr:FecR domain-containing protein [Planctomycetota bacterium]